MRKTIFFYRQEDGKWRILDEDDKFDTVYPGRDFQKSVKSFDIKGKVGGTDKELVEYKKSFTKWCKELYNKSNSTRICYDKHWSHNGATIMNFVRMATRDLKKLSDEKSLNITKWVDLPKVDYTEHKWMDACFNGGMTYCRESIKNKKIQVYSYDFVKFYPTMLGYSGIQVPINKGKESYIKKIPKLAKDLPFGYYKALITSDDPEIRNVFCFSKNNIYTHKDLTFARVLKTEGYKIKVKLCKEKPNCYIYDKNDIVSSKCIFGEWYKNLIQLNEKYPKNKLLKTLLTRLWGSLCQKKIRFHTLDDAIEYLDEHPEYDFINTYMKGSIDMCVIGDPGDLYKHPLVRMKPHLMSSTHTKIAKTVMPIRKHVVRLQTDCITCTKEMPQLLKKFKDRIKFEEKSSGLITFKNCNNYTKHD